MADTNDGNLFDHNDDAGFLEYQFNSAENFEENVSDFVDL